jgi:hypothetical protein
MPMVNAYVMLEIQGDGTPNEAMPIVSWFVDETKVTPELEAFLGVGTPEGVK